MPTANIDAATLREWFLKGIITAEEAGLKDAEHEPVSEKLTKPDKLVPATFVPPATWLLPIVTASEANGRDWRGRSNRTRQARSVVCACLAPHWEVWGPIGDAWRRGDAVRARFVRLGGKRLDVGVNLPSSLKAVEDAVCLLLGVNDGSPNWQPEFDQQPGGLVGVRLSLDLT